MTDQLYSAGDLDHRISLLKYTDGTPGPFNEPTISYSPDVTVWASRTDASAGERLRAREVSAEITAHLLVRYSPETASITPKDRVQLEGGDTYDILSVRELRRNEWLEINAVTRAD